MNTMNVLVVGDHLDEADILAHGLTQRGISADVIGVETLTEKYIIDNVFAIVIFDINEDAHDLVSICQLLSKRFDGPTLVMCYENDERFLLELYRSGIAEYVIKPIGLQLLVAKVTSWMRRISGDRYSFNNLPGHFQIDEVRRVVTTPEGANVRLSKLEFRLFDILYRNRPHILMTRLLCERIWGQLEEDDSRLKSLVRRLRRKVEPDPSNPTYIETVSYKGYRFRVPGRSQSLSS